MAILPKSDPKYAAQQADIQQAVARRLKGKNKKTHKKGQVPPQFLKNQQGTNQP